MKKKSHQIARRASGKPAGHEFVDVEAYEFVVPGFGLFIVHGESDGYGDKWTAAEPLTGHRICSSKTINGCIQGTTEYLVRLGEDGFLDTLRALLEDGFRTRHYRERRGEDAEEG
jgi:hypothetical protein